MNKKILIIEDDEEMAEEINEILKDYDYKIYTVKDGIKAKKYLTGDKYFSLILLDLKIPEIDGFEILKLIKDNKIHSKIVVFSSSLIANSSDEVKINLHIKDKNKENLLNGVDFILKKPVRMDVLLNKIQELI